MKSKPRRITPALSPDNVLFAVKQRRSVPHEFVLDAMAALLPRTRSRFGCLAVYVVAFVINLPVRQHGPYAVSPSPLGEPSGTPAHPLQEGSFRPICIWDPL